jgi:hypothetical protein
MTVFTIGRMASLAVVNMTRFVSVGIRGMAQTLNVLRVAIAGIPGVIRGATAGLSRAYTQWGTRLGEGLILLGAKNGWKFATGCGMGIVETFIGGGVTLSKATLPGQKRGYNYCKYVSKLFKTFWL